MSSTTSDFVFNSYALLWSGLFLFGILVFHGFYMFFSSRIYRTHAQRLINRERYKSAQAFFMVGAFFLSLAHIFEILLLGYALKWIGLIENTHQAIVFAGSTYTTVGFGTDPLPVDWDLITVTMALSGLITIAWTTSVLFGMATYSQTAHDLENKQKTAHDLETKHKHEDRGARR